MTIDRFIHHLKHRSLGTKSCAMQLTTGIMLAALGAALYAAYRKT